MPDQTVVSVREGEDRMGVATADVVVVGGGSAGAVLATRLSERSDRRIVLLEAGHVYAPWSYPRQIADSDKVGDATGVDWGYRTEPGYVGHPIGAFRGRVLGGSSAINGAVAIRARPQDLCNWKLPGWSYEDLLPSFKLLEDSASPDARLHGKGGPFPARQMTRDDITPMQRAFIDAAVVNNFRLIDDWDGPDADGVGPYIMNIANGVRVNTGMAYLTNEVRDRANLTILGDAVVDKVLIESNAAIGVRLANGQVIHAGEVILSAGAYGSPAILMRSGIGPADDLRALGIATLTDLPVGRNLKDHPFYYNAYAAKPERIGRQTPVIGAKLWTHSSTAVGGDLDLHITATHLFPHEFSPTGVGFVLAVALTRPRSVGRIWIDSADPHAAPRIDPNFLADPLDRARLIEGVRLARRIGRTSPLADLIAVELAPGPAAETDAAIQASINATLDTYHHPTSSVPMGAEKDPKAVVDLEGRIRGIRDLRVVDASIFPDAISVATNVTTIAVAEHIASLIA